MNISTLYTPAARKSRSLPMSFLLLLSFLLMASNLYAADVSLTWNKNQETDLASYQIYQRLLPSNEYGNAIFSGLPLNPDAPQRTITNLQAGRTYGFILTATDTSGNISSTSEEATVTTAGSGGNQAPTVSAGPNQTITLPSNAPLNGTVTDDGLPSAPGTVTTTWSKVSGPGTVTFGNTGAVDTTASFSVDGVYVLRLRADDSAVASSDDLTITVNPTGGGNGGTISNLTPASYVVVPTSPGLQAGGRVYIDRDYTFTSVPASVQGAAYIQTANNDKKSTANPFLSFTVDQSVTVYVAHDRRLALPVWLTNMGFTDTGENLGTSDVPLDLFAQTFPAGPISLGGNESRSSGGSMYSVIVQATGGGNPTNQAPTVSAGPNQTITLPSNAPLNGSVSDDGLPSAPGTVTTTWSKVSGPGTVTVGNTGAVDTTASFSVDGVYVLRLRADDGAVASSDDLTITVNSAESTNQAPTVSAGPNQTITLPSNAPLNGSVSDDGLPSAPGTVTTTWSKVSGPGTVTVGNTGAVDTTASFSVDGVYVLRLRADDGALTRSDDLTITVNPTGGGNGGTISNLTPASYVVVPTSPGLQAGGRVYIDRDYTFTSVPASVQGAAYIQTANNDKKSTANPFLSFTVDQSVTVYVAHDRRLALPVWLTNMGFTDTGENLGTSDVPLDLFAQTFPAGPISLGGNESRSNGGSMYSVIVQATVSAN